MPIDPSTRTIDIRRIFTGIVLAAVLLLVLWLRGLPLLFVILLVESFTTSWENPI